MWGTGAEGDNTASQLSHLARPLDHHTQGPNIPFKVIPHFDESMSARGLIWTLAFGKGMSLMSELLQPADVGPAKGRLYF